MGTYLARKVVWKLSFLLPKVERLEEASIVHCSAYKRTQNSSRFLLPSSPFLHAESSGVGWCIGLLVKKSGIYPVSVR